MDVPEPISVNFTTGTTTIASLDCAETLNINGGTLIVSTTATITGSAALDGGAIQGGTWVLSGPLTCSSSNGNRLNGVEVVGDVALTSSGSQLTIQNGLKVTRGQVLLSGQLATLRYSGSQTWGPATVVATGVGTRVGDMTGVGTAVLTLGPDFALEGVGWQLGPTTSGLGAQVLNQGLIRTTAVGNAAINPSGGFTNAGTVQAQAGTLSLPGPVTNYQAATGALSGGTWSVGSGAALVLAAMTIRTLAGDARVVLDGPGSTFLPITA